MPYPVGTNVEDTLEEGLRKLLKARTDGPDFRKKVGRFLPSMGSATKRFQWVVEGEEEPAAPFGKLSKKSQSRFGNGLPVYRYDSQTRARYLEEEWRISIALIRSLEEPEMREGEKPSLSSLFSQIMREQFKFPQGRTQLEEMGIYNVRLTDEGDNNDGNSFSFDCRTETFFEEAPTDV